jgi:GNAT superfamily N-acetyltransferase
MAERRREVVEATLDRVGALAPVFGRAFVEEPMTLWSLGGHGDVEARLTSAFSCFLEQVVGLGLVSEATGGPGAAVWIPPDRFKNWAVHPWSHPQIIAVAGDGRRYEAFWDWVGCHHPAQPVWLLDSLAVEPAAQGRGLGRALVAAGLASARADGISAFLSTGTERNVEIYGRFGFRLAEAADAPEGGPTIYFMRWDP